MKNNQEIGIRCLEITDVYPDFDSDKKKKKKIVVYYFPQKNIYSWNYLFDKTAVEKSEAIDPCPEQFFFLWKKKEALVKPDGLSFDAGFPGSNVF